MKPVDTLLVLLVTGLWGLNFVVAKTGLEEFPPLLLIAFRFLFVALLLVWFVPPPRGRMGQILAMSVTLGSLQFGLAYVGLAGVDASVAAVAIQLQVPFAAILAAVVFKDRLGWRGAVGLILAFIGVIVIAGEPRMETSLWSLALVIAGAAVWAISNVQVKRFGLTNVFTLNAWTALFAAPQVFVVSLLLESGHWTAVTQAGWKGWGSVAYVVVAVSIVGYGIWYHLLPRYPMNRLTPFSLLVPFLGVLSSVLLLGEPLTWPMVIGGILTVAGVALLVFGRCPAEQTSRGAEAWTLSTAHRRTTSPARRGPSWISSCCTTPECEAAAPRWSGFATRPQR